MKVIFKIIAGLMLAGPVTAVLVHAQPGPARLELERFAQDLDTLQARFEQQVINREGLVEAESGGQVWLQRPGLFRWEYGGDFPEMVVADGTTVWLYDVTLEQVTVRDQSGMAADTPLTLLTDLSRLDQQFEVTELESGQGLKLLQLTSRNPEAEFERVLLGFRDDMLTMMAMEDAFGLRTEIHFSDIRRNPVIEPGRFEFEIPPGTDVIGDLPSGNSGG